MGGYVPAHARDGTHGAGHKKSVERKNKREKTKKCKRKQGLIKWGEKKTKEEGAKVHNC